MKRINTRPRVIAITRIAMIINIDDAVAVAVNLNISACIPLIYLRRSFHSHRQLRRRGRRSHMRGEFTIAFYSTSARKRRARRVANSSRVCRGTTSPSIHGLDTDT